MNLTRSERVALVERGEEAVVPISLQADLLSVSHTSLYYEARAAREREVQVKRRLDEWYTAHPFLGTRKVVVLLAQEGIGIGRHTIARYRRELGLETLYPIYPKPNLSKSAQGAGHKVYPYLLRGLSVERSNQVWGVDITYIRLAKGWLYLTAFLDWHSRFVVAWELSDTLEMGFVLSCGATALSRCVPEIVNSDQGSHFTSERFTALFLGAGSQVSIRQKRLLPEMV